MFPITERVIVASDRFLSINTKQGEFSMINAQVPGQGNVGHAEPIYHTNYIVAANNNSMPGPDPYVFIYEFGSITTIAKFKMSRPARHIASKYYTGFVIANILVSSTESKREIFDRTQQVDGATFLRDQFYTTTVHKPRLIGFPMMYDDIKAGVLPDNFSLSNIYFTVGMGLGNLETFTFIEGTQLNSIAINFTTGTPVSYSPVLATDFVMICWDYNDVALVNIPNLWIVWSKSYIN
jgi:hypothetical protein